MIRQRFDEVRDRIAHRRSAGSARPPVPQQAPRADTAVPAVGRSELRERHDEIARQFAELHWDLGGIAYEMAIRDHFRLDVLVNQAARVQRADAELAEVERLLRLEDAAAAGSCPSCGALYARGAVFCWQCGNDLMPKADPAPGSAAPSGSVPPPAGSPPAPASTPSPTAPPPSEPPAHAAPEAPTEVLFQQPGGPAPDVPAPSPGPGGAEPRQAPAWPAPPDSSEPRAEASDHAPEASWGGRLAG